MNREDFIQTFGFFLVLLVHLTPSPGYAQSSVFQNGQNPVQKGPNPPVPNLQQMPPVNPGNTAAATHGICPSQERIGPFLTSDDAELAAQSARFQLLPASPVYSQGWPDSLLDPLRYYFYVTIFTPCN